jgi:hypothetical protein
MIKLAEQKEGDDLVGELQGLTLEGGDEPNLMR